MKKILPASFFERPVLTVGRELLGMYLVRRVNGGVEAYMIVETEAYGGPEDKASHARSGKTARNWPMFERGGTIYVYRTYGLHWLLNISTGREGEPSAVLIRGVVPAREPGEIRVDGPARLTKHLRIDSRLTGRMLGKAAGLWIEDRGCAVLPKEVSRSARVGVAYAGAWGKKPWRFSLAPAARTSE